MLATLRASWWIIVALIIVAGAGAYAVSQATPARYRSSETLIYLPAGTTTAVTTDDATRDLQTAVGLVQAAPVIAPAALRLGVTQEDLRSSVSAALPTDANLIRSTPPAARRRGPQSRPRRRRGLPALPAGAPAARDRRAYQCDPEADPAPHPARQRATSRPRCGASAISCRSPKPIAPSPTATSPSAIPARVPTAAFQPQPSRNAVLGAVAGLLIGIATAFGRARLNRKLMSVEDVETAYGMRAIGAIPPPGFQEQDREGRIIGDFEASSPLVEAFRSTRATLSLYAWATASLRRGRHLGQRR